MIRSLPTPAIGWPAASRLGLAVFFVLLCGVETFAQNWEFTLHQRRANDQICVEVWGKAQTGDLTALGQASLVIDYNSTYLSPAAMTTATAANSIHRTDSINFDVDVADPVDVIVSQYHNGNGYSDLGAQAYASGPTERYGLEVRLGLGNNGLPIGSTGKGSFIGKICFDISGSPTDSTLTDIKWNTNTSVGDIRVFDASGNDVESSATFTDPADFTIVGITILNPNGPAEVVDRDKIFASVDFGNGIGGYPIYFERSGLNIGATPATNANAYVFEYSLNGGSSWFEFGRVVETTATTAALVGAGVVGANATGEISTTATTNIITTHTGATISETDSDLYRTPLRVIWHTDATFFSRSENARIRITQLSVAPVADLSTRTKLTPFDISDADFVIGRLFFLQFDGSTTYARTQGNFSNPTQITAEAWVNLNSYQANGSEPAVLASSAGPLSDEEGAWKLYLNDGRYPAFRAREIEGRGPGGYVGVVVSDVALDTASDASPLGGGHSANWVHLAATVANDTITLYVNGEIAGRSVNDSATDIRMGINQQATNFPIWLGVNPDISIDAQDYLHAGIKGAKVWRAALSQDQIRQRIAGISNPTNTSATFSLNRTLELYWTLEGTRLDAASEALFQNGSDDVQLYVSGSINNASANFRPDQPHLRLTAPVGCEGISNIDDEVFTVRWVGYGIGNITSTTATADLDILFSLDGGTTFTYAKTTTGTAITANLGGLSTTATFVDLEAGSALWEPFNNNGTAGDDESTDNLRTLAGSAYSDQAVVRIRGRNGGDQNIFDDSDPVTIAPYFYLDRTTAANITVDDPTGAEAMSFSGQTAFFEAWIRPLRYPTSSEGYFPIMAKLDPGTNTTYYSFRLLSTGQLEFRVTDTTGVERVAQSDTNALIQEPNITAVDTPWTHVGVYVNLGDGVGGSDIRFYIDGTPQSTDTSITNQLGDSLVVQVLNEYPFYIGNEPTYSVGSGTTATVIPAKGFLGAMREVRFWNGNPGDNSVTGTEPTALTQHIQGAQAVNGADLVSTTNANLVASFAMDGGGFVNGGFSNSLASNNANVIARVRADSVCYEAATPYLKLVEPVFKQQVRNTETALKVRWVGYNYSGVVSGASGVAPSLEFSIRGGGGTLIQPYQYVASDFWAGAQADALSLPTTPAFRFVGGASPIQIAGQLNVSTSDPDPNDDEAYDATTGPLSATLTNGRFRLTATTGTVVSSIQSEGPLFTLVPQSNFTVRAVLEGYHTGTTAGMNNIGTALSGGGMKITLYEDAAGSPGAKVAEAESEFQYASGGTSPVGRGNDGNRFADVPFIFSELVDGNYWVVVEHLNHLPVMSRFAAPFQFAGDDVTTWDIESGWDFQSWDGDQTNLLLATDANPYTPSTTAGRFTAFGNSINVTESSVNLPDYSNTGLIFNEGQGGATDAANPLPALVAGDVESDGQVNAGDRNQVRQDDGTTLTRSDVTGDGSINALDRDIVDRNFGKVSSIANVDFPNSAKKGGKDVINRINREDPLAYIDPKNTEMSEYWNESARAAIDEFGAGFEAYSNELKNSLSAIQAGEFDYVVTAVPVKRDDEFYTIDVYIRNNGKSFSMGNATFGITYRSNLLDFIRLENIDGVPYHNKPDRGYSNITTAPEIGSNKPIANLRTIEIDYNGFTRRPGNAVPSKNTRVGTLRFRLKNPDDANRPLIFSWHQSTVVLDTRGHNITGDGDFQPIKTLLPYTASVTIPNGGEQWRTGKTYDVRWTNEAADKVFIEYSLDGGAKWERATKEAVQARNRTYSWRLPANANTQTALVRIIDEQTGIELDRSDDLFAIAPADGEITRPAAQDPIYTGGKADRILWNSDGIDRVRFEFSSDGGSNWVDLQIERPGGTGNDTWIVPANVNTKRAVMRMIDADNGDEVARSGRFKVLSGDVEIREPRENQKLDRGAEQRIRWTVENLVEEFDLELSIDGGQNWSTVQNAVVADDRFMMWSVPDVNTNQAILRAFYPGDPELEYDRTPPFTIGVVSSVGDAEKAGYTFDEIYPNPVDNETQLRFTVPKSAVLSLTLINAVGEEVAAPLNGRSFDAGTHSFALSVDGLATGVYYLKLQVDNYTLVRKLVVKR